MSDALPGSLHARTGLDSGASAVRDALVVQRRRLAELFATFDASQWAHPSRCDAWTVHDVARHIVDTMRITVARLRGDPPVFSDDSFDPRSSPRRWLEQSTGATPADTVRAFESLRHEERAAIDACLAHPPAEGIIGPYGLVPWSVFVLHVHWDNGLHERDIVCALGHDPAPSPLEVRLGVLYGLHVAAVPAELARSPLTTTIELDAERFEIAYRDGIFVGTTDSPAALRGDRALVMDALAGRGPEVAAVLDGDPAAVEPLSWLRAFMLPDSASA